MESLNSVLERNRETAIKLMLDNEITHISITDNANYGRDTDTPCVLLANKQGEVYDTEVTDIKLVRGDLLTKDDIYIKVVNTTDLSSHVFVDKEGYISRNDCYYHTDNAVYLAIEYYCQNFLYFDDKIYKLRKDIEKKFIELLSDEDERTFIFEDCDMFHTCIATNEESFKSISVEDKRVMLKANTQTFPLGALSIEGTYNLLQHLIDCLEDKC
jgi:hypothetical protein